MEMNGSAAEISALLERLAAGDTDALDGLYPLVYEDLRRVAHRRLAAEAAGHTLNTTALVHESYLRLAEGRGFAVESRAHLLNVAARAMRQILVDHARRRTSAKRGSGAIPVPLDGVLHVAAERSGDLLELHEALERLSRLDERQAQVVECKVFGGMTVPEIAEALGVSPGTVKRDWSMARACLATAL